MSDSPVTEQSEEPVIEVAVQEPAAEVAAQING